MNKENAKNIIKFLDQVTVKGHVARQAMNDACDDLLAIVNDEVVITPKLLENDGKTDAD